MDALRPYKSASNLVRHLKVNQRIIARIYLPNKPKWKLEKVVASDGQYFES